MDSFEALVDFVAAWLAILASGLIGLNCLIIAAQSKHAGYILLSLLPVAAGVGYACIFYNLTPFRTDAVTSLVFLAIALAANMGILRVMGFGAPSHLESADPREQ